VLALSWPAAVAHFVPGAFAYWWETEILRRVSGESHRNMPFLLYFPILFGGSLPAGLFLPAAVRWLWRELRAGGPDRAPGEFLIWWTALPLAVFCAAKSRLPLYLLPLFPPLALLVGRWAALRWGARPLRARTVLLLVLSLAALGVGARTAAPHVQFRWAHLQPDPRPAARAILADARASGARPETFVTARFSAIPACGLAFYLASPVGQVELNSEAPPAEGAGAPRPLAQALAPAPPGVARYFAVLQADRELFEGRARSLAEGRWLMRDGDLWVWRLSAP
jgi:4-amino-4-deoxy-L-arabinose transferase-like glycosyltransferase